MSTGSIKKWFYIIITYTRALFIFYMLEVFHNKYKIKYAFRFMFLLLSPLFALEYYIKDYYSERFMSSEEMDGTSPTFSTKGKPDLFEIKESDMAPGKSVIRVLTAKKKDDINDSNPVDTNGVMDGSMVLEVAPYKSTLIYYPFYNGLNQFMYVQRDGAQGKFRLMHEDKCVGFDDIDNVFELVECDGPNVQYFDLIPPQDYIRPKETQDAG